MNDGALAYRLTPNGVNDGQIELDENWIIREIRVPAGARHDIDATAFCQES